MPEKTITWTPEFPYTDKFGRIWRLRLDRVEDHMHKEERFHLTLQLENALEISPLAYKLLDHFQQYVQLEVHNILSEAFGRLCPDCMAERFPLGQSWNVVDERSLRRRAVVEFLERQRAENKTAGSDFDHFFNTTEESTEAFIRSLEDEMEVKNTQKKEEKK